MVVSCLKNVLTVRGVAIFFVLFVAFSAPAVTISSRYRSPRNPERKVRPSTELIVLHTTEAPARSSLNKLSDRGEAHYCVTEEGSVYAIVDRDREAFHAGRSMWNGKEDVDKFSIGIECVGNHDKPMPTVQLAAIRDLVKDLQRMYRLADDKVVCHGQVAYGSPNKWQKKRHRGRKRCGMLFSMPSVRRFLNLKARPAYDPDTRAGRLVVGDPYLKSVLYGSIDTMVRDYPVQKPKPKPVVKTAPPKPAATTDAPKSVAELKERGFILKGSISPSVSASKLAGGKWNAADTYYTIRNKVISGTQIDPAHIEKGMCVWMKK